MGQVSLMDLPVQESASEHQVLARKYRPKTFSDLHGQDVLVKVLTNGLKSGKLSHAFVFTGIRGVGKTTTARLLARALNCSGRDISQDVNPCGTCEHCEAIAQDRHIDVIEMDAASRTGVDDIREVIDASKYKAVSGKYKIYIIDEVHMLSKSAFNALLKTLEEPPENVKFVFATTEIHKVPKTVLSRCMRFDLARLDIKTLKTLFADIAQKEGFDIEDRALTLIARAADGSARDGISMLDQSRTMSLEGVTAQAVQQMLGLSEAGKVYNVLLAAIEGDAAKALEYVNDLYAIGADPNTLLNELLNLTHTLSCLKVDPKIVEDLGLAEADAENCQNLAERITVPSLTRMWQVLIKGADELRIAPVALQALQMVILRMAYASQLPSLEDIAKGTATGQVLEMPRSVTDTKDIPAAPTKATVSSYEDVVELFSKNKEPLLHAYLKADVNLVSFEPGRIELVLSDRVPKNLPMQVTKCLKAWTGQDWDIVKSAQSEADSTLQEQEVEKKAQEIEDVKKDPMVAQVIEAFPGTTVKSVE